MVPKTFATDPPAVLRFFLQGRAEASVLPPAGPVAFLLPGPAKENVDETKTCNPYFVSCLPFLSRLGRRTPALTLYSAGSDHQWKSDHLPGRQFRLPRHFRVPYARRRLAVRRSGRRRSRSRCAAHEA